MTTIPGVNGKPMQVIELPDGTKDFVTHDGRYFAEVDTLLDGIDSVLHEMLPMVAASGRDPEEFSNHCHILINYVGDGLDGMTIQLKAELLFAQPDAEDPYV